MKSKFYKSCSYNSFNLFQFQRNVKGLGRKNLVRFIRRNFINHVENYFTPDFV